MPKLLNTFKKNETAVYFLFGGVVALLFYFLIFGTAAFNPFSDAFIANGYIEKDLAQHYSGWLLYRNSPWQFPIIGMGENLAQPYGASVGFSDSIPLFAVIFKVLSPILPQTFQYFGIFTCLCFFMQGGFAALIAKLFKNSLVFATLSALLFSLTPIFLERTYRHVALSAQFLVVASLYFYFKNKKSPTGGVKPFIPFVVINALAIAIHPYFLPFTFGIMFAFCTEEFFRNKKYWQTTLALATSICITLFIGFILGLFTIKGSEGTSYGLFSMNLNAFFNPVSTGFSNWSRVFKPRPVLSGQLDSFNYLGVGVMVAAVIGVIGLAKFKKLKSFIISIFKNHFGLLFSSLCLTVFAVSNIVTYGGLTLFTLPLPQFVIKAFSVFRASGRFGNMFVYLLLCFIVYAFAKIDKKYISQTILLIVILIQAFDISGVLLEKHNYFYQKPIQTAQRVENRLCHEAWTPLIKKTDRVMSLAVNQNPLTWDLAVRAGQNGKKVNLMQTSRNDTSKHQEYANSATGEILSGIVDPTTLFIIDAPGIFCTDVVLEKANIYCLDGVYILLAKTLAESEKELLGSPLAQNIFTAKDLDSLPFENGVNADEGVIVTRFSAELLAKLQGAKAIAANGQNATIEKVYVHDDDEASIYIKLADKTTAINFAYGNLIEIR